MASNANINANSSVVQDLISMIDAHLAFQIVQNDAHFHSLSRQSSRGTMFVDFDENTVEPIISYRNDSNHKHSHEHSESRTDSLAPIFPSASTSAPRTAPPLRHTRRADGRAEARPRRGAEFDSETESEYNYGGRVVHVNKAAQQPKNLRSGYYSVEAGEGPVHQASQHRYHHHRRTHSRQNYNHNHSHNHNHHHDQNNNDKYNVSDRRGSTQARAAKKNLPAAPPEKKKRNKVVHFLQRLLSKLGTLEPSNRSKDEDNTERRKPSREHRADCVVEPVPRTPERWTQNGYHT
ncbi:hypothetical protein K505DRAFT_366902 [Melanomma pulvis-pyrius CBS 109.77]|uniref:Uncharacterized protein n=1 Tax=Melanomma pulvis-pyrius CBS 109.77 TaxID=1314802 RepID=A0A6A6WUZ1_9PLEO|nr:hypothetical protein K505DRAFT_366902 [Melanomma pulvis-pyrius CBS 109.77]